MGRFLWSWYNIVVVDVDWELRVRVCWMLLLLCKGPVGFVALWDLWNCWVLRRGLVCLFWVLVLRDLGLL